MTTFEEKYSLVGKKLGEGGLLELLLNNRGVNSKEEQEAFLSPKWEHNYDPFLMKGMKEAVACIAHAVKENQKVLIFSDFDADGVPGAVVLHDFFRKIGFKNFEVYIPNRNTEGFGLNIAACEKFVAEDVNLLITIDCGIANIAEVGLLREGGVDVIVTDHHLPREQKGKPVLPNAIMVNPKQPGCEYPFKELCGSGVIFKLVQALLSKQSGLEHEAKEGWEKSLMDMVGVATLCDMVPLVGENRLFAWAGLQVLRMSPRPGLHEIFKNARVNQRTLVTTDATFTLGPRINAASRMGDPIVAFHALAGTSNENTQNATAIASAQELEKLNRKRKSVVMVAVKEAYKKVGDTAEEIIVLGNPEWPLGIVGLVAGKLAEKYGRPAFVWTRVGDAYKGSARSGNKYSVHSLMNTAQDTKETFVSFGGHDAAGGFVCTEEQIHFLGEKLVQAQSTAKAKEVTKKPVECELPLSEISSENYKSIVALEPYGMGNPCPLFYFKNIVVFSRRFFGKEQNHLELSFKCEKGFSKRAIRFNYADSIPTPPEVGQSISMVAAFELNTYNGYSELRLRIENIFL